jgi:dUTP pyrophosphatase
MFIIFLIVKTKNYILMSKLLQVKIKKLQHADGLPLPSYATLHSAGMDLLAAINENKILKYMERILIPTGIAIALPIGYEAQIRSRSGLAAKNGVVVINAPGTIDSDYRGEVFVPLINFDKQEFIIERGMRIAQMVIGAFSNISWNLVDVLDETERNDGGFGSTGV